MDCENKKYYWLKLKRDFFKRHDIRFIKSMPNGEHFVLIYLELLSESVDHNGKLRFSESIPYNAEMLAAIFGEDLDILKAALKVFTDLQMLEIEPDGTIKLTRFDDFVGGETKSAAQKRRQRNLPTLLNGSKRINGQTLETPDGIKHHVDDKRFGGNGMLALDRARGRCENCGSGKDVVIHHNNGYSNELDDLVVLCLLCHGRTHNKTNKGFIKINRPPYVGQMSAEMSAECPPLSAEMSEQSIEYRVKSKEYRNKSKSKEKDIEKEIDTNNVFLRLDAENNAGGEI